MQIWSSWDLTPDIPHTHEAPRAKPLNYRGDLFNELDKIDLLLPVFFSMSLGSILLFQSFHPYETL